VTDVRGAFNVAAEPVLDARTLAEALHARAVPVSARAARAAADASWRMRLQPSPPGWIDLALAVPLMDTTRARTELGWTPRYTATEALLELLGGLRDGADFPTPPLAAQTTGPWRVGELRTRVGASV
jgi:nucleoside-diphosphate-sugar epimerase